MPQLFGRSLAMRKIIDAGRDRVAVFGLTNEAGMPIYVHSKTCIIDHRWASVGSDNLNRRSWTYDSEIACTVIDDRDDLATPAPLDSFPRNRYARWSPSTSAVTRARFPRTRTRCSTRWWPAPTRLTSGTPVAPQTVRPACAAASPAEASPASGPGAAVLEPENSGARSPPPARTGPSGPIRRSRPAAAAGPSATTRVARVTALQLTWAPRLYHVLFDPDGRPHPGKGN